MNTTQNRITKIVVIINFIFILLEWSPLPLLTMHLMTPAFITRYLNSLYPMSQYPLSQTIDWILDNIAIATCVLGSIFILFDKLFPVAKWLLVISFVLGELTVFTDSPYIVYGPWFFIQEITNILEGVILVLLFIPRQKISVTVAQEPVISKISQVVEKNSTLPALASEEKITTPVNDVKKNNYKRKFPYLLGVWLNCLMLLNFFILYHNPAFTNMKHFHDFNLSAIIQNDLNILVLIQIGFLICIGALYKLRKWGFFGLLVLYLISLPIYYYHQDMHMVHTIFPLVWISLTYLALNGTKIGEKSAWNILMNGRIKNNNLKASDISASNRPKQKSKLRSILWITSMLTLIALFNITFFFPMPSFLFAKTIYTNASLVISILIIFTMIGSVGIIMRKEWGQLLLSLLIAITFILNNVGAVKLIFTLIPFVPLVIFSIYSRIQKHRE